MGLVACVGCSPVSSLGKGGDRKVQVSWVTGLWRCISVTLMTLETLLQKKAALHAS